MKGKDDWSRFPRVPQQQEVSGALRSPEHSKRPSFLHLQKEDASLKKHSPAAIDDSENSGASFLESRKPKVKLSSLPFHLKGERDKEEVSPPPIQQMKEPVSFGFKVGYLSVEKVGKQHNSLQDQSTLWSTGDSAD